MGAFRGRLLALLAATALSGTVAAQPDQGEVVLDGLSVLAGAETGRDSDAQPVLLSDVEFEAALLWARRYGSLEAGRRFPAEARTEARRVVVLVRLLAGQARRLQETASRKEVDALTEEIVDRVGGSATMERLLSRFGLDDHALVKWAEDSLLAATQVRYLLLQADIPFLEARPGASPGTGPSPTGEADSKAPPGEARRSDRIAEEMRQWLGELLGGFQVRIIR